MFYKALFQHIQQYDAPISTRLVKAKVCELVQADKVEIMASGLDVAACRGFYLSPRNTRHRLVRQFGRHIIVLARSLPPEWRRFILMKELVHMLDGPDEATDSGDKFDTALDELTGTIPEEKSKVTQAEISATWKALSLFCPEHMRLELETDRGRGHINDYAIALALRMPELHVPKLFVPMYRKMYDRHMVEP